MNDSATFAESKTVWDQVLGHVGGLRQGGAGQRIADRVLGRAEHALERAVARLSDASRTAKFLRGRLAFTHFDDDVFVSSYPRSGTTWTQLILYLLCSGADELSFEHLCLVSPWWERSLAWGNASDESFLALPRPRVFKSHLPHAWLPANARCVYVTRRGEDVAVSYYHLYRSHLGFEGSFDEFFERFLRGDLQYGSWFKHVAGWQQQRGNPRVLFLAYEDMKRAPEETVGHLADFLGLEVGAARVAEVAELSSFASMKAHEDKFDHLGELRLSRKIRPGQFIRSGTTGQASAYLSADQRARFASLTSTPLERPDIEWRLPDFLH
ncbi:sulfotransferase domain-containing protein [Haliangium ochraceum]|uniref:Sulfotransferase n=1 Tax=Haliangium ochraceum (strain DSM 14365 / JCM 11303 / SMP-2) TaxID=502025 RepID=D0LKW4_HALO1|nr:sulfotransferase domain-containing protein [Haliangium ochraceum]ACY16684.1 sulfotransferase [Haliangium ochraceum DSM 14365]